MLVCGVAALGQATSVTPRFLPALGKSVVVREESRLEVDTRIKGPDDREIRRRREAITESVEMTVTVLDTREGVPTRLTHFYKRAQVKRDGEATPLPWHGKTLQITLRDGKALAEATEGGALKAEQAEALVKALPPRLPALLSAFLPGKPVRPGEEWEVSAALAARGLRQEVQPRGSWVKGKLVKSVRRGGSRFGVVEVQGELALADGKAELRARMDGCLDGASTLGAYRVDVTVTGWKEVKEKGRLLKVGGVTRSTMTLEVGEEATP
jgi:hypothetical protein